MRFPFRKINQGDYDAAVIKRVMAEEFNAPRVTEDTEQGLRDMGEFLMWASTREPANNWQRFKQWAHYFGPESVNSDPITDRSNFAYRRILEEGFQPHEPYVD